MAKPDASGVQLPDVAEPPQNGPILVGQYESADTPGEIVTVYQDGNGELGYYGTGPDGQTVIYIGRPPAPKDSIEIPPVNAPSDSDGPLNDTDGGFGNSEAGEPSQPCPSGSIGEPGFYEGLIPIWGSARQAINDFQTGHYISGVLNTALAVSDVFLVKAMVVGAGKVLMKTAGKEALEAAGKQGAKEGLEKAEGAAAKEATELEASAQKLLNPPINVTEKGLEHVIERHTIPGLSKYANKSKFFQSEDVVKLIKEGTQQKMILQPNGRYARTFEVGRDIGIDRATNKPTGIMTIITDAKGNLVTAFPGKP